jgi:hypothetical protein
MVQRQAELILKHEFASRSENEFQQNSRHALEQVIRQSHLNNEAEITWLTSRRELLMYEKGEARIWQTKIMRTSVEIVRRNNNSKI